ncbi:pyridoxal-dependent decarboxylase [Actinoplanes sp. NPDC051411]|uniref:pyridoxal phosphate-dependent decarboxylase family protein n=1 Tax=Actinoplanes sp. NPDC051411 TaxID=3155522 RepID=UPI003419193F
MRDDERIISRAVAHALRWASRTGAGCEADMTAIEKGELPYDPGDPAEVVEQLARLAEPGLREPGLRGAPPRRSGGAAALGADWLTSAWNQNTATHEESPATAAIEAAAARWLRDLLGLPARSDVGFVTDATMATFTALAAARSALLADEGWDLDNDGLAGAPRIAVLAAEAPSGLAGALRYLGLGRAIPVGTDGQGRMRASALATALDRLAGRPAIVCLRAGHPATGAFDPFPEAIIWARSYGAWVHVDGAAGLWSAASPALRHVVEGSERADSWTFGADEMLGVPYECHVAAVARPEALRAAMGGARGYLVEPLPVAADPDPAEMVPEFSRRARGVPVWAALRALGRLGVAELVERRVEHAQSLAAALSTVPGAEAVNDVVSTSVCVAFGTDARTRGVAAGARAHWAQVRLNGRVALRFTTHAGADPAAALATLRQAVRDVSDRSA